MMTNTFCHVPGIGLRTEKVIWDGGISSWEGFLECPPDAAPLGKGKMRLVGYHLEKSLERFGERDVEHFAELLPTEQHWRLFEDFRSSVAYLDIETTGMAYPNDHITTIALYDGKSIRTYVYGDNLLEFREDIRDYRIIVSYNGKSFDVPFIRSHLRAPMEHVHIDLRYILKSLGYRGGLKGCERQLGIDRGGLSGVDGFFAVLLWQEYVRSRKEKALETLLAYNIEDAVNLEALMVMAFNKKLRSTPFAATHELQLPARPEIPYRADAETIERTRRRMEAEG